MKTTTKSRLFLGVLSLGLSWSALAANPTVNNITVRQCWPWSRAVNIDYDLTTDSAVDVVLKAYNGSSEIPLIDEALSGSLYNVTSGRKRIVWDPTVNGYTNSSLTQFSVTLTPTHAPAYMIVDLTKSPGDEGQIDYVYSDDARLAADGNWYSLTNEVAYKTTYLVLRRIPAGSFLLRGTSSVTLTKDYYIGVFEMTQWQWNRIAGYYAGIFGNAAYRDTRPTEYMTFNSIRGAMTDSPSINWPTTGYQVGSGSMLGLLRAQTGLMFDLPTESQLEYACRAGTTSYYNDGLGIPSNTKSNAQMNAIGRYCYNGGRVFNGTSWVNPAWTCDPTNGTALIGSYPANNWGLYDTLGNAGEWCRDWYAFGYTPSGTDPTGPSSTDLHSGARRIIKGGNYYAEGDGCAVSVYNWLEPANRGTGLGLRLIRVLP